MDCSRSCLKVPDIQSFSSVLGIVRSFVSVLFQCYCIFQPVLHTCQANAEALNYFMSYCQSFKAIQSSFVFWYLLVILICIYVMIKIMIPTHILCTYCHPFILFKSLFSHFLIFKFVLLVLYLMIFMYFICEISPHTQFSIIFFHVVAKEYYFNQ